MRPRASSQCRVSCTIASPNSRAVTWRRASCSIAFTSDRSELRFLISQRVPNSVSPTGRTDTFASMRSEPSSIFTSETPIASSVAAQLFDIPLRLLGRTDVGLGHDLEQRHAGAVVVDERVLGVVDAAAATDVQRLAGVLFEVRTRDADALSVHLELTVDRDRQVVLRGLVVLRHVGIEVVLPREHRAFGHVEVERLGDTQRVLDRLLVQHRAANRAGRGTPGTRSCSARCRTRSGTRRTACSRSRARSALRDRPRSPRSSFRSQTSRGQTTDRDESLSPESRTDPTRYATHHAEVRNGVTIAYVREGAGGTPLLLLHGYPETKRIWWRNIGRARGRGLRRDRARLPRPR